LTSTLVAALDVPSVDQRRRTADWIFRGALLFNTALTLFWLVLLSTGSQTIFFQVSSLTRASLGRVGGGILFFYVIWGFIWYGIKTILLKYVVGFSKDERRQAFSSRMNAPFDVASLVARHSERRIRIVDMIGRRGRFITLAMAGFFYMYGQVASSQTPRFATLFLAENLFDAVVTSWIFLAF
jgi:hypothetical protein